MSMELILNTDLLLYILSFIVIWFGAGLIISSVEQFSQKLKLSSFAVSFFVLGILTSVPEFAVGMTAIAHNDPEIFVGNLLGGIPVIFLLIIPLLAIFGNGIKLTHTISRPNLLLALGAIALPSVFLLDKKLTNFEGLIFLIVYLFVFYLIEKQHGIFDIRKIRVLDRKYYSTMTILKIIVGIFLVFISSQVIVNKTLYFSQLLSISPFYLSLIALSLGTNVPELSIAVRSVISKKRTVAFGDYIGSAAANTLFFGIFTLLINGEVLTEDNFLTTFLFIALGLGLFYVFAKSKNAISRGEGFILLGLYAVFVVVELL